MTICLKDKWALLWIWGDTHSCAVLHWNMLNKPGEKSVQKENESICDFHSSLEITFCWDQDSYWHKSSSGSELPSWETCDLTVVEQSIIIKKYPNYTTAVAVNIIHRIQCSGTAFSTGWKLWVSSGKLETSQNSLPPNHLPFSMEVVLRSSVMRSINIGSGEDGLSFTSQTPVAALPFSVARPKSYR